MKKNKVKLPQGNVFEPAKEFEISITGSGTKEKLIKALKDVVATIEASRGDISSEFEDETLYIEISSAEDPASDDY